MTPGARISAAIELMDEISTAWEQPERRPLDAIIAYYFRQRRYIGSKDRAAIAEMVYYIVRNKEILSWWVDHLKAQYTPRSFILCMLAKHQRLSLGDITHLFNGERFSPAPLDKMEKLCVEEWCKTILLHYQMPLSTKLNFPAWMQPLLESRFGDKLETEMQSLNEEAPVDIRANTLKTNRDALQASLASEGFVMEPTPLSPIGLRMTRRSAIFTSQAFKLGWFEMQDAASQMVALMVGAKPGEKVVDFCAGAGGKTLALAAEMQNKGQLLAWDTSKKRLEQMPERLKRAGVDNVRLHPIENERDAFIKRHKESADRVLADVPCSGSGTWRRNPDLKWRFTMKDLQEMTVLQASILDSASRLVKVGGRLVYATCSLFESENESQIATFLEKKTNFRVVEWPKIWDKEPQPHGGVFVKKGSNYLKVSPHQDGVDGFFAAVLERVS